MKRKSFNKIKDSDIRYNSKCFICDKTNFTLEIHHIDGNSCNNDLSNALFICSICHDLIHSKKIVDGDNPTKKRYLINTFRKALNKKDL